MIESLYLRNIAWAVTTIFELVLLVFLARRRLYRTYPALFLYVLVTPLQNALFLAAYRYWGFYAVQSWNVAWGSQAVVICVRYVAVVEVARRTLAPYSGIWALAWRVLLAVGAFVAGLSILLSHGEWTQAVSRMEMGLDLSIAAVIVTLFLFARYYALPASFLNRSLLTGFCLYSCFCVVNYAILEPWINPLTNLWNFLHILAFLASLLVWIYAVRARPEEEPSTAQVLVSKESYGRLSAELNVRLHQLNQQLDHMLRSKDES